MATKKTKEIDNLEYWADVEEVPVEFLKEIKGGRLRGMTDISPMWRIWKLTEKHGPIGTGWYYKLIEWRVVDTGQEQSIQAHIELYIGDGLPITGVGGSKILAQESSGAHHNDEALKMAVTDAISVACKQLGYASAIYEGRFDGSKYQPRKGTPAPKKEAPAPKTEAPAPKIVLPTKAEITKILRAFDGIDTPAEQLEEIVEKPIDEWTAATIEKLRDYYKKAKEEYDKFHNTKG